MLGKVVEDTLFDALFVLLRRTFLIVVYSSYSLPETLHQASTIPSKIIAYSNFIKYEGKTYPRVLSVEQLRQLECVGSPAVLIR